MPVKPAKAMVLAAGLGQRMRPLTDRMPKPLVSVGGRPLLDHVLDKLGDAGVSEAIVNVHYLPDQIIEHVRTRKRPRVIISDERNQVLGTGGGVVRALPLLGDAPFYHLNADTLWIDGVRPNLARLAEAFDPARMDILLLMPPAAPDMKATATIRCCPTARCAGARSIRSFRSSTRALPSFRPPYSPARRAANFR
jgi:MurNAc alpha-1-phosphate uridylyltransferase